MTFLIGPEAQELFFKSGDATLSQDECYHFMQAVFGPGVVYDAPKKKRQMQFQTLRPHDCIADAPAGSLTVASSMARPQL